MKLVFLADKSGKIIYLDAEMWLAEFLQEAENIYCERSIGGDGFHRVRDNALPGRFKLCHRNIFRSLF